MVFSVTKAARVQEKALQKEEADNQGSDATVISIYGSLHLSPAHKEFLKRPTNKQIRQTFVRGVLSKALGVLQGKYTPEAPPPARKLSSTALIQSSKTLNTMMLWTDNVHTFDWDDSKTAAGFHSFGPSYFIRANANEREMENGMEGWRISFGMRTVDELHEHGEGRYLVTDAGLMIDTLYHLSCDPRFGLQDEKPALQALTDFMKNCKDIGSLVKTRRVFEAQNDKGHHTKRLTGIKNTLNKLTSDTTKHRNQFIKNCAHVPTLQL